jgi:hypothetical protein
MPWASVTDIKKPILAPHRRCGKIALKAITQHFDAVQEHDAVLRVKFNSYAG